MIIQKQELDFRNCMDAEKMSDSHISAHTVQERWNQDAKWNRAYSAVGLEKKKTTNFAAAVWGIIYLLKTKKIVL